MWKNLLVYLFLITACLYGDEKYPFFNNPEEQYYWVTFGIGGALGLYPEYHGISGAIIPTLQYNNHIIHFRYSGISEIILDGPSPWQYVSDMSLLYGRCLKGQVSYASLSAGIGMIKGMNRGKFLGEPGGGESYQHEELPFRTIGLSLDAQMFIMAPVFGVGEYIFSNINDERSYWSFLLCLQFGHINSYSKR